MIIQIKRALISVSDKTDLLPFAQFLDASGVEILSTGGTAQFLRDGGVKVTDVSNYTGFPEMLDGRIKTLHPKIHGGLLGRRDSESHLSAMAEHGIEGIDMIVINLYPFSQTVAKGASEEECIENIDIGGPAMIRSAAKNYDFVTVIVDPKDYPIVQAEMTHRGGTSHMNRKELASIAFARTAAYDAAISNWFIEVLDDRSPTRVIVSGALKQKLRYGENPHQNAAFYVSPHAPYGIATAQQIQGKELSYNNINDADAAFELVSEFESPAIAIIKHANPCGVALADTLAAAYSKALACDPVSAYGGVLATNKPLDAGLITAIGTLYLEVIIAPDITPEAQAMLEQKKNLRVLLTGGMPNPRRDGKTIKSVSGGFLTQDRDNSVAVRELFKPVSERKPTEAEINDMLFACSVAKHVKSNAIVLAKNQATIGIGAGQMSRVDSIRIACLKAADAKLATEGCVLASDAFFPFDDNVHLAAKHGITGLVHPGGSIRDEEVIKAANQYQMAMVVTNLRNFKH